MDRVRPLQLSEADRVSRDFGKDWFQEIVRRSSHRAEGCSMPEEKLYVKEKASTATSGIGFIDYGYDTDF